jgi:hypothetical protein
MLTGPGGIQEHDFLRHLCLAISAQSITGAGIDYLPLFPGSFSESKENTVTFPELSTPVLDRYVI